MAFGGGGAEGKVNQVNLCGSGSTKACFRLMAFLILDL